MFPGRDDIEAILENEHTFFWGGLDTLNMAILKHFGKIVAPIK